MPQGVKCYTSRHGKRSEDNEEDMNMGSLIGATVSCLWQAAVLVTDVIAYGAGVAGGVGT